ncbi:MAG: hypothetical protein AAGF36_06210 [Pseudomonadota bacterium]
MTRYLIVMICLLAGVFVTAALVMPTSDAPQLASCNGVADYPVQRLAEGGDIEAMVFLGERWVEDGCAPQDRAQGLRYLEHAAAAGHERAQTILNHRGRPTAEHRSPLSACVALLAMVLPGVDDPHLVPGACD